MSKLKSFKIVREDRVVLEIEAEKLEFYLVPDTHEVVALLLVDDGDIVAAIRDWDDIYT